MRLNIGSFTLETCTRSLFARLGSREVFIERPSGQPLGHFDACSHEAGAREVWFLGFYGVVSRVYTTPTAIGA